MDVRVIIAAAGSGTRFGQAVLKQFARLGGMSVLGHTIQLFIDCGFAEEITVVLPPDFISGVDLGCPKIRHFVRGKKTRAESVYEGLMKISQREYASETVVLVHDGVRPLVSREIIKNVAMESIKHGVAIAASRVTDTIKKANAEGFVSKTVSREFLWKAATPQGFRINILLESYKKAMEQGYHKSATDEAFLAERAGFPIFIVESNPENIKITTPADLVYAEALLKTEGNCK